MSDHPHRLAVPLIRRARGFRLYDAQGRRFIDLWQAGGRALLGHRSTQIGRGWANVVSRGLLAALPSGEQERLLRRLTSLLPGWRCVLAPDQATAMAWARYGLGEAELAVTDPARGPSDSPLQLWRPHCEDHDASAARALILILPYTVGQMPTPVCFRDVLPSLPGDQADCHWLSPVVAAVALAGLAAVARRPRPVWAGSGLLKPSAPWRLRGIYLAPQVAADRYPALFQAFLAQGMVLNPELGGVSILPAELSEGEVARLRRALNTPAEEFAGGSG